MEKDFDRWNEIKKRTNDEQPRLYTVREIWWCRLGVNVGTEQDGSGKELSRPCVIVRGFGSDACMVVPLSTSKREHQLRISIGVIENKRARANISQIRIIDTRRLIRKIGFLEETTFELLRDTIRQLV